MKKLIAMLLCIAMIAALGANAFAIVDPVAPSAKDAIEANIAAEKAKAAAAAKEQEQWTRAGDFANALEQLVKDYDAAYAKATTVAGKQAVTDEYNNKVAALGAQNQDLAAIYATGILDKVKDLAKADGTDFEWAKMSITALKTTVGAKYDAFDANVTTAWAVAGQKEAEYTNRMEKAAEYQADLDVILAAEAEAAAKAAEAAAKAAEAAKEEAAAIRAANAAVKDPKTEAEQMKWNAAYAKYWLDKQLKDEKDDAKKAKDGVKTAQEAAVAQAKNAVERAQILAYQNMQAEIDKAVGEYLDGVKTALADFYWELYG